MPVDKATVGLEAAIAWLGARQHRVVALAQLVAVGLGPRGVRNRVASGALRRIHRGVYAVGHAPLTQRGHWMAAVLACGPGAVLSHRDAAALLGLRTSARGRIDVTTPLLARRKRPGIDHHRSNTIGPQDVTAVDGIPCTTVARTVVDLADVLPRRAVEWVLDQAEVLRIYDGRALDDVLARAGNRRGASTLRAILAKHAIGRTLTRRELEERFLALCDRAGLRRPEVNIWVALDEGDAFEVDFLWRRERLIVETDSWEFHGTRGAFERDRLRDQRLMVGGWRVIRLTWRQILSEPASVERTLRALLATRAGPR